MATQTPTELESFHRFLTEQLRGGGKGLSPEESLNAFRAYQRDLARLQEGIQPAVERFHRGPGGRRQGPQRQLPESDDAGRDESTAVHG